ncbi:hypothetical protein ACOSP7_028367 [Xanthoceras sorbifolium]|uniref:Uncharacterized protein n=1 Tax=Xanthoceras sorbifolium TaxID=99658 RepID=A0ABQ8HD07_9ROSI|nr:hypothetical protein JRO89_XS12G0182600 [Xanthoceras sorbifolium]
MKIRLSNAYELPVTNTREHECLRVVKLDELIFHASCVMVMLLLLLPMKNVNGKPVPTVVFDGLPSIFHAYLVCLMGACYASVCSIYTRDIKPKIAWFYSAFALAFMALSLVLLFLAAALAGIRFLFPYSLF